MTAGIAWLGYLADSRGLLSAIIGHTIIDVYLLIYLQRSAKSIPVTHNPDLIDWAKLAVPDQTENRTKVAPLEPASWNWAT
jgi:hypothetical protein